MTWSEIPCLSLAIDQLVAAEENHFAIWVLKAPYPGGYVHHDCFWTESLTQTCQAWQEMFSLKEPSLPSLAPTLISHGEGIPPSGGFPAAGYATSYSSRLMQNLGISLWQWLFEGAIQSSLDQSQGIAMGQNKPLRVRLEVRAPALIALPWEIMQSQAGKQAISLSQQLLFSRTTSDVDPLPLLLADQALRVLLVLGDNPKPEPGRPAVNGAESNPGNLSILKLEQEAAALVRILESCGLPNNTAEAMIATAPCQVDTLLQPTAAELIERLETGSYNILFYSGHGIPGPDGGLLFLQPNTTLNGTELAQVLTRCRVTLTVFNACWGAQPAQNNAQAIPRSSLAEVLIHHGVPAVLAMRDSIADQEALSFIQAFAQALAERLPIDQAVAVARQQLLTLYKFNQPAWTLPVLYMHPEFNGELIQPLEEGMTELPENSPTRIGRRTPNAYIRLVSTPVKVWSIRDGFMRVGRRDENDLVIPEQWVSQRHAEIFCRESFTEGQPKYTYFLRDFSRYGTLLGGPDQWQKIHHQEVPLLSGIQLKFGSSRGQTVEFIVEGTTPSSQEQE
ncbi:signal peptide protein [Neosynechococcus sphagnicola sy1]|uniref:Signal peptide protein n=1 Tax=Neosynechococcus sphagnicola sy1 TaxID=1497020 RepID=A0A098TNJ7_9CYAN|nr:CHAT domain-containing protein [Neosynechococcus sphagnicola]KGF73836.1 signal peptide protein [Neosynechococcus sphagnicola sy1]